MFVQAYINSAKEILTLYKGEEPLSFFLKKYFTANKKFGSRDRKQIAHLCYCFFRLGKSLPEIPVEKKLALGIFLCDKEKSLLLKKLDTQLHLAADKNLDEKVLYAQEEYSFHQEDIFFFPEDLSDEIIHKEFGHSFLVQPRVYLRIRPGLQE